MEIISFTQKKIFWDRFVCAQDTFYGLFGLMDSLTASCIHIRNPTLSVLSRPNYLEHLIKTLTPSIRWIMKYKTSEITQNDFYHKLSAWMLESELIENRKMIAENMSMEKTNEIKKVKLFMIFIVNHIEI